jgi:DNA-binding MarR family transcriptional regulator
MLAPRSAVAREIRQSVPFRSPAQEATVALLRTADLLRRHLGGVMQASGVTLQQYNVLRILRGAGEAGLPTLEIGERMVEQAPGTTRLLDRLEAKGLARRRRCPHDRRQVLCFITPQGLALLAGLDGPVLAADQAFFKPLKADRLARFVDFLDRIRAGSGARTETKRTKADARRSTAAAPRGAQRKETNPNDP